VRARATNSISCYTLHIGTHTGTHFLLAHYLLLNTTTLLHAATGGQEPPASRGGAGGCKAGGEAGGGERVGTFASQTPLQTVVKRSWIFKMYVDVLHAQSTG